jgi:hypothetical protein
MIISDGIPPDPTPLPVELDLAHSQRNMTASACGCGWKKEQGVPVVAAFLLPFQHALACWQLKAVALASKRDWDKDRMRGSIR